MTFVSCGTVSVGAKKFVFMNNHIINPTTVQSYKVRIAGSAADQGITMVAIVNQVPAPGQKSAIRAREISSKLLDPRAIG